MKIIERCELGETGQRHSGQPLLWVDTLQERVIFHGALTYSSPLLCLLSYSCIRQPLAIGWVKIQGYFPILSWQDVNKRALARKGSQNSSWSEKRFNIKTNQAFDGSSPIFIRVTDHRCTLISAARRARLVYRLPQYNMQVTLARDISIWISCILKTN